MGSDDSQSSWCFINSEGQSHKTVFIRPQLFKGKAARRAESDSVAGTDSSSVGLAGAASVSNAAALPATKADHEAEPAKHWVPRHKNDSSVIKYFKNIYKKSEKLNRLQFTVPVSQTVPGAVTERWCRPAEACLPWPGHDWTLSVETPQQSESCTVSCSK